ncbi:MAG: TIGR02594 family protein [Candidatus Accumulibacter phosphatis]|nr:TIGR02594 family protein [Candidatus Accumulibacter phosphatis]
MNTIEIQRALRAAGFDPGEIDGVRGRQTIAATKAFQAQHGLAVDGIVGPSTAAQLFGQAVPKDETFAIPTTMPWVEEAFHLLGTREIPGRGSNEAIMGWAEELALTSYNDDDIPWCGLFVAHCIGSQLPEEKLPRSPLGARSWAKLGNTTSPQLGAVMVFWRESRNSGKGHVGFYWAEDGDAYHILGGNQSNAVTVTRVARDRFLDARWPSTALRPSGITRQASKNGKVLSQNEA